MDNRYIGAVILSPLLFFLVIGGVYLKYLVLILALIGMHEFYTVVREKKSDYLNILAYFVCVFYFITLSYKGQSLLPFIIGIMTLVFLCIPVFDLQYNFIDAAKILLGFIYVGVFFSYIPLIGSKPHGNWLVWLIFIASWLCDTSAYYVGKHLGKRKLCPEVSPKKTVEGAIGGFLGSMLSCGVYGYFIVRYTAIPIPMVHFFIVGALCGILCQLGDLTASSIKRNLGVKDYSHLIPGHGGVLDRFDSILFASVVVYYYITIILGM